MNMFRGIWIAFCMVLGAAIVAIIVGTYFSSVILAIVGAIVGLAIGYLFGRYIKLLDWLTFLD